MSGLQMQFLAELGKCVDRGISLDEFRQWFVPRSIEIEESNEPDVIELVHCVDGILAEASSAEWSEEELRDEMENIVCEYAPSHGNIRRQ